MLRVQGCGRVECHPGKPVARGDGVFNAGGIKLAPELYREDSSLKARGGNTQEEHPLAGPLRAILQEANQKMGRPAVSSFNHCGMAYAFYNPEVEGILLGVSRPGQLEDSLDFYKALKTYDYRDLYQRLKELSE